MGWYSGLYLLPAKVSEIDEKLRKNHNRECVIFMASAQKYQAQNPLNEIFLSRLKQIDQHNFWAVLRLYFGIFQRNRADEIIEKFKGKYKGEEAEILA